jgi:hypothetical protein
MADSKANGARVIRGTIAKWDAENGWHTRDGEAVPSPVFALGTGRVIQRWKGKELIEEITEAPLPNVKELNAAIPQAEWEPDLNGKPRPPYALYAIVYLLNPVDAGVFTHINSTAGTHIAAEKLEERMQYMQMMRGANVKPLVTLGQAPMRTRFGVKSRPSFDVVKDEWREFGGGGMLPAPPPAPQLTHGGGAGFHPDNIAALEAAPTEGVAKYVEIKKVGKAVKPATTEEALNDELPSHLR